MNKKVIVYSTNDCIECTYVKQLLVDEGVLFEIRDISTSEVYQQEVEKLGFLGVPVTVLGERAIKGFIPELQDLITTAKQ